MKIYRDKKELIERLISKNDVVVDIGFWGQGVDINNPAWIHDQLKAKAKRVYGLDIEFDSAKFTPPLYIKANAEDFSLPEPVDVVFAGDLIEHLSNPGLFLESAKRNLSAGGRLIVSTPNTFNLFNLVEKLTKNEPTVNKEHTFYFNRKTLDTLFTRHQFEIIEVAFIYKLDVVYQESWKKKILNLIYRLLSKFTDKFIETIVIVAKPKSN